MKCGFGYKAVEVLIDGVASLVCQEMTGAEKNKEKLELGLTIGLAVGLPVLVVLACVCVWPPPKRHQPTEPKPMDPADDLHAIV